jgi:hypothetical protein
MSRAQTIDRTIHDVSPARIALDLNRAAIPWQRSCEGRMVRARNPHADSSDINTRSPSLRKVEKIKCDFV